MSIKTDAVERGINLIRKLEGKPRRTSFNRDSYSYRNEGAEVLELAQICTLWRLRRRYAEDVAKKFNIDETDLADDFLPDFTEASYKIAYELERGYFVSLYQESPDKLSFIFDEWDWIDNVMDKVRLCRRATDYKPLNDKELELTNKYKPNQTTKAKADVILASDFPEMTKELALKIVKNQQK